MLEKRKPNLNFIAPELSPTTKRIVELKLKGYTNRQICEELRLNKITVLKRLQYARDPMRYLIDKERHKDERFKVPELVISKIRSELSNKGYMFSDEIEVSTATFRRGIAMIEELQEVRSVIFTSKAILGPLANKVVVYNDKHKVASKVTEKLIDFFSTHNNFRTRKGDMVKDKLGIKSILSYVLPEIFFNDKKTLTEIKDNLDREFFYKREVDQENMVESNLDGDN